MIPFTTSKLCASGVLCGSCRNPETAASWYAIWAKWAAFPEGWERREGETEAEHFARLKALCPKDLAMASRQERPAPALVQVAVAKKPERREASRATDRTPARGPLACGCNRAHSPKTCAIPADYNPADGWDRDAGSLVKTGCGCSAPKVKPAMPECEALPYNPTLSRRVNRGPVLAMA